MAECVQCFQEFDGRIGVSCAKCGYKMHKECSIKEKEDTFCDNCYTLKVEDSHKPDFDLPEAIRRSYIETYRTCPYKFYLEVLEGHTAPPTIYTQLGIDLHDMFEKASNDRSYTQDQMMNDFLECWHGYGDELFESDEQKEKMYQRGINSVETFYHHLADLPKEPFATEETLQFSIGSDLPKVQITMDRIDEYDGELDMLDWKTGKVMVGKKLSSDLQAPLYIKAVQEHFGKPVRRFSFHYLDENKTRVFERISDVDYVCTVNKRKYYINLNDAVKEVQSMFARIKKGQFSVPNDYKKMHFACKMCHLRKEGKCAGAYEQSWLQLT